MARFTIPRLVRKPLARGGYGYYWQPSATLQKKGWKPIALGSSPRPDDPALIDAARAKNAEVDAWSAGGSAPREISRFVQRYTMADVIGRYRDYLDDRVDQWHLPVRQRNPEQGRPLAPGTRKTYETALRIIEEWTRDRKTGVAGGLAAAAIDAASVAKLKAALMTPDADGVVRWNRAHGVLRVLNTMMGWAADRKRRYIEHNPAEKFDLPQPPGRDQVWDEHGGRGDIDAIVLAAGLIGFPSIGLAVEIAEYTGQREADVVRLARSAWQRVHLTDRDLVDRLRGDDDELMGIFLTQGKTSKPMSVPIVRPLRGRIEQAMAAGRRAAVPATTILVNENTGRPWTLREFIRRFNQARALAVAPTPKAQAAGLEPRPGLAELQFRDLRRTRVVRMSEMGIDDNGISSITGHSLKTIRDLLDRHYKPRTTRQASLVVLSVYGEQARSADAAGKTTPDAA